MLRIVTDGATDFPAGWEEEFDIQIIPINIHFGEETYIQNVEMNLDEFYKKSRRARFSQKLPNHLRTNLQNSTKQLPKKAIRSCRFT